MVSEMASLAPERSKVGIRWFNKWKRGCIPKPIEILHLENKVNLGG